MSGAGADSPAQGVVLAGGDGTRFDGREKAVADVGGRPILARVLEAVAAATASQIIVAVRDEAQRETHEGGLAGSTDVDPRFVSDAPDFEGPVAGLLAATGVTDAPWLFVTASDMPLLDRDAIAELLERRTDAGVDAVVPRGEGGWQPLHAAYRRAAVTETAEDLERNASLHALLDELENVVPVDPVSTNAGLEQSLTNVNTVEELDAVRGEFENEE